MGKFIKNRVIESGSTSVVVPAGNTADRPTAPIFGQFRFNLDNAELEFFNGIEFLPLSSAQDVVYTVDNFVGDGSTTVFTMSTQETVATQVLVFVGSIYQDAATVYSVNGTFDITFSTAPPNQEPITVIHTGV